MKRVLILSVILLAATGVAGLFAEGQVENDDQAYGRGRWNDSRVELEEVDMTGEVFFEDRDFPMLKTADGEYTLMVPRFYTDDIEIKEGQTITIKGFIGLEDGPRGRFAESDETGDHVMVTSAVIDGNEYDLGRGPSTMMRGGSDMRGGGRPSTSRRMPNRSPQGGRW